MKYACLLVLLALASIGLRAQVQPVKDLDTRISSSAIGGANFFRKSGSLLYFANVDEKGAELWRTDGTKPGTFRLTDNTIGFGTSMLNTRLAADFDGELVFASGGEGGSNGKLWKTNGTVEGTRLIAEATLDGKWISIETMGKVGNQLIILGREAGVFGVNTYHLFVYSNDTEDVTYLKKIGTYTTSVWATGNDHMSFAFYDPNSHTYIWSSDGTTAGTGEVAILDNQFVNEMIDLDALILMNSTGTKVIKYDRSNQTVSDVVDVYPGATIQRMFKASATEAIVSTNVSSLVVDGNPANTTARFGSIVFDTYYDGTKAHLLGRDPLDNEIYLFDSDLVLSPGEDYGSLGASTSFFIPNARIIPVGDRVFTTMWSPTAGFEPAVVEDSNVQLIKDINPGTGGSNPQSFAELNGKALFVAASENGALEIWTTDGTEANTQQLLGPSTRTRDGIARNFYSFNNEAWFLGTETLNQDLWVSSEDGQQVTKEKALNGGTFLGILNNELYTASQSGITRYDGTNAITVKDFAGRPFISINLADDNMILGNKLIFPMGYPQSGIAGEIKGHELWVTDGTTVGTFLLRDIYPGSSGGIPTTSIQGRLKAINSTTGVFAANNGISGFELWKTDGTVAGTTLLKDINPGSASSGVTSMVAAGGYVYFRAFDGTSNEIWKTDGTPEGTVVVTDLNLEGAHFMANVIAHDNKLFFAANENNNGWALYNIEADQVIKIKELNHANHTNMIASNFLSANGLLYFSADDGEHGQELWVSDGTTAGTRTIDIVPGAGGSYPRPMFGSDGQLFLSANGQFYHTTGFTNPVVEKLSDLDPLYIRKVGSSIFFSAFSNTYGIELFRIPYPKFNQSIEFTIANRKLADGDFKLSAVASSGLSITYSTTSSEITINESDVDVKSAGSVTITAAQAGDGMFNSKTENATFCVNPDKPGMSIIPEAIGVTSTSQTGNQWFLNGNEIPNATDRHYTPVVAGDYTVQVIIDGCKSEMSDVYHVISIPSGLEDEAADLSFYPNPASDRLTISWPSQTGPVELTVITAQGSEVEKAVFSNTHSMNVAQYSNAIYILRMRTATGVTWRKFVKR